MSRMGALTTRVVKALEGGPLREVELLWALNVDGKELRPQLRNMAARGHIEAGARVQRATQFGPYTVGTWRLPGDQRPARDVTQQATPRPRPAPVPKPQAAAPVAAAPAGGSLFEARPLERQALMHPHTPAPQSGGFLDEWKRLRGEAR